MLRGVFATATKQLAKQTAGSDSDDEGSSGKPAPVPAGFKCRRRRTVNLGAGSLFMLDAKGNDDSKEVTSDEEEKEGPKTTTRDVQLEKTLAKASVQPGFEQNYAQGIEPMSRRQQKKRGKEEREKTTGSGWFDMPASELTDERKRDLELLMMRGALDPRTFYRKNDRTVFPKYFQVGTVVDAPEDWYASRIGKKQRKKTMVDEVLADERVVERSKRKFDEMRGREKAERTAYFRKSGRMDGKKKKTKK